MDPEAVFKFCPRCRAELVREHNKISCKQCGLVHYINPIPCNAVIITNDSGEIMLVERRTDPFAGKWDLPGGFIDLDEDLEGSIRREIREELGVELEDLKYVLSTHDRYLYKGVCDYTVGFIVSARIKAGENPAAADDAKSFRFFKPAELPWDDIAFASVRKGLRFFLESLKP
jgi:NAD+ diphosphatase